MSPLSRAAALVAAVAHEVATEYRKLDAPPPPPQPARQELSCVSGSAERRATYDVRQSATGHTFGFGQPPGQGSR